jgi:hypothetical protein
VVLLSAAAQGGVPRQTDDEIRRGLADVLARPEFAPAQETLVSWLARHLKAIADWLGNLRTENPPLYWTLLIVCLVALALLGTHMAWTVRRVFGRPSSQTEDAETVAARQRRSQAYADGAREAAARQEYTEAIRLLFLSLVYRFDEAGRVSFQRSYTNREYLALFADRPDVRADLAVFVDTLDNDWYGEHSTQRQRYEQCLDLYSALTRSP